MDNYIQGMRKKIGRSPFIHPAARIIIENQEGEILTIVRQDNGKMGIPAGALEWNETIEECIKREVKEETGLRIKHLEVIGISSNPTNESVEYPNGDCIQYFTIEFYSNEFEGTLLSKATEEIKSTKFLKPESITQLPKNEQSIFQSLTYYRTHGKVWVR